MRVSFRQGIVSHQTGGFLSVNGSGNIDISTSNRAVVVTIAHKQTDYLFSEDNPVSDAWVGPFTLPKYWLYWDFNPITFARTFGYTTLRPIVRPTMPNNLSETDADGELIIQAGRHWFNSATNTMYEFNGVGWAERIRVFAALLANGVSFVSLGTAPAPDFTGTQIGSSVSVDAGRVLFDDSNAPILRSDKTFFTTEDDLFASASRVDAIRLESNVIRAQCTETALAAYSVVAWTGENKISTAQYENVGRGDAGEATDPVTTVVGMLVEDLLNGEIGAVIVQGVVTNPQWNWTATARIGAPLWVDNGLLVTEDPHITDTVDHPQPRVPVARVLSRDTVIFEQGLGGRGSRGPAGSVENLVPATTTVLGGVTLLTPSSDPFAAYVVSDTDPRLTDPRTPLPHSQPAVSVTVPAGVGAIPPGTAQSALAYLDANKVDKTTAVNVNSPLTVTGGGLLTGSITVGVNTFNGPQSGVVPAYSGPTPASYSLRADGSWVFTQVGSVTLVDVTGSPGLTITGAPITSSGTLVFTLSSELQGLSSLSGTGLVRRSVGGVYTASGLTVNEITSTLGYVPADELVTITAGSGLVGGGDLTANRVISMPDVGTPGTYAQVTTDQQGRVVGGSPTLDWTDVVNTPTSLGGYGILDAVPASRTISTTAPLTGGGSLSGDLTLSIPTFDDTTSGIVPVSPGGTSDYLRADGTWATPPNPGGTVTSINAIGSTGLVVTGGPISVSGTLTFTLGAELQALSSNAGDGFVRRNSGVYTTSALTASEIATALGYTPLAGNQTITLAGDVVGSGATLINVSVNDDSHNHTVATITAAGTPSSSTFLRGDGTWTSVGTVTSVDVIAGAGVSTSGGPITLSGAITINNTGVLSFNTRTGDVTLTSADVTVALGYTPVNKAGDTLTGFLTLHADPTNALHAVTKQYVDNVAAGLDPKESVRAATTANIVLSGTQTVDGVALVAGDRVLVKNQITASENGIYVVAVGAWTRASDFDGTPASETTSGAFTFVEEGSTYADTGWVLTTNNPITVGTTALTFTQFSGAGTYVAGTGLQLAGNSFSLTNVGTAGTYTQVTTDAQGRVTSGTNPTTLSGYGITDGVINTRAVNTTGSLTGGGNLTADRTISLVNDNAAPGNFHFYGTNETGTKGFYPISTVGRESQTGLVGNPTVTLNNITYQVGAHGLWVYLNGQKAVVGVDFNEVTSTTFNWIGLPLVASDVLEMFAVPLIGTSQIVTQGTSYDEIIVGTPTNTVTLTNVIAFAKTSQKAFIQVFLNGILQREGATGSFTVTSPTQLTFSSTLATNDEVLVYALYGV